MQEAKKMILPRQIRWDASTVCQLKCPSCPTASGETRANLGAGFLKFADFKKILDENPWLSNVELSNWGE
ncbi:MAG: radical SAM protein, partial [Candidatus Omnitrophica bacterium]|nr:radical SAM protein [Candidatus Omnitrophota bacterium]